jgi:hypothetical protein
LRRFDSTNKVNVNQSHSPTEVGCDDERLMSALGQKRTSRLFDYFVSTQQK